MTKQAGFRIERVNKVWTPDAKLYVPHGRTEIGFASPSFGPDAYQSVGKLILTAGLKVPTGDYTASLLHSAYCDDSVRKEPEFEEVREIIKNRWLWVFNQNLWTDKGVYVILDSKAKGKSQSQDLSVLERQVNAKGVKEVEGVRFSKSKRVRFAPKETYALGEHTTDSLLRDGFVIANYGSEGAKKLAEVLATLRKTPSTYGVEVLEGNAPEQRVSALGEAGDRLHVLGYYFDDDDRGHAFGVL